MIEKPSTQDKSQSGQHTIKSSPQSRQGAATPNWPKWGTHPLGWAAWSRLCCLGSAGDVSILVACHFFPYQTPQLAVSTNTHNSWYKPFWEENFRHPCLLLVSAAAYVTAQPFGPGLVWEVTVLWIWGWVQYLNCMTFPCIVLIQTSHQ